MTKIEEQAKRDNYLVTDQLLKTKDKEITELKYELEFSHKVRQKLLRDIDNLRTYGRKISLELANVKEGMKYAVKVATEMQVGATSALNVARYFKGKWEKAERKLLGDFR